MSLIPFGSQIIFEEAKEQGLHPEWETEFGLFSVQHNGKTRYVYSTHLLINSTLGAYLTKDKYTTNKILEKHGFPIIPYIFTKNIQEVNHFFDQYNPIIAKPVMGEQAHDVKLITHHDHITNYPLDETLFEKFIQGEEYRYLVLQGKVVAAQSKNLAPTAQYPWRKYITNLEPTEYKDSFKDMALKIAELVGLGLIAVDFLLDDAGKPYVLELNSAPGLYSLYNPDKGNPIKVGKLLLEIILNSS